jgi:hypothetical protein
MKTSLGIPYLLCLRSHYSRCGRALDFWMRRRYFSDVHRHGLRRLSPDHHSHVTSDRLLCPHGARAKQHKAKNLSTEAGETN